MSKRQCPGCGYKRVGPIRKWRRNTRYVEDELNYRNCCYDCIKEDDYNMFWNWKEYYSSIAYPSSDKYTPRLASDYVKK